MESTSPTGELRYLTSVRTNDVISGTIQPKEVGTLPAPFLTYNTYLLYELHVAKLLPWTLILNHHESANVQCVWYCLNESH